MRELCSLETKKPSAANPRTSSGVRQGRTADKGHPCSREHERRARATHSHALVRDPETACAGLASRRTREKKSPAGAGLRGGAVSSKKEARRSGPSRNGDRGTDEPAITH